MSPRRTVASAAPALSATVGWEATIAKCGGALRRVVVLRNVVRNSVWIMLVHHVEAIDVSDPLGAKFVVGLMSRCPAYGQQ